MPLFELILPEADVLLYNRFADYKPIKLILNLFGTCLKYSPFLLCLARAGSNSFTKVWN